MMKGVANILYFLLYNCQKINVYIYDYFYSVRLTRIIRFYVYILCGWHVTPVRKYDYYFVWTDIYKKKMYISFWLAVPFVDERIVEICILIFRITGSLFCRFIKTSQVWVYRLFLNIGPASIAVNSLSSCLRFSGMHEFRLGMMKETTKKGKTLLF